MEAPSSLVEVIKPSYEIQTEINGSRMLKALEKAARICYKTEDKITDSSAETLIRMLIYEKKHESVIEHESITVKFICDRGVTHELVRHRLAAYSQESTRYCNYNKKGICFILPLWCPSYFLGEWSSSTIPSSFLHLIGRTWLSSVIQSATSYDTLIRAGWKPQQARSVLPNSLKTEIIMTANVREWRHIFKMRTSEAAHPQIREIMVPLLEEFRQKIPVIFETIETSA